jgi:predicted lipid-binding transport protein (Tim44 family)
MIKTLTLGTTFCVTLLATGNALAQQQTSKAAPASDPMASCPMHAQHMAEAEKEQVAADGSAQHGAEVNHRHDTFGMPHTASTHSFRLFADGGAIELRSNIADDEKAVETIRTHLQQVAEQFKDADFSTPAFVHGHAPDGVASMGKLRADIAYRYEELPAGGRIRITTKSAPALAAVHDFLRFQVTEHRTANSGKVEADQ